MFATWLMAVAILQPGPSAPPLAKRQNSQLVPLIPGKQPGGEICTHDLRWCVSLAAADGAEEAPRLVVRAGTSTPHAVPVAAEEPDLTDYSVWPKLVMLGDGSLLAGIETRVSTAYSGGGGSATNLQLFHVSKDGMVQGTPVLDLPVAGSLLIRACFGEADITKRRGACHDEYAFSDGVTLAEPLRGTLPDLLYRTEARSFPKGASRSEDSSGRRLKKADLAFARDPACSFLRRFAFDAASGSYKPESPLPDCSDYTAP